MPVDVITVSAVFGSYSICQNNVPVTPQRGYPIFFKRTYHDQSASLAVCPAGLMMFLQPDVTTNRLYFIINPVGTRQGFV